MEALDRWEGLSRSVDIRTNGRGISKYTQMRWETTKEMHVWHMKIHLRHILLAAFIIIMT